MPTSTTQAVNRARHPSEYRGQLPTDVPPEFLEFLKRPVAFHPALARLCGSVAAGLVLSQAIYWNTTNHVKERGGWFYKNWREWESETCLTRREQDAARSILRKKGFIVTELRKVNGVPTLHYRVKFQAIFAALGNVRSGTSDCTDECNGMPEDEQTKNAPERAMECTDARNPIKKQESIPKTNKECQRIETRALSENVRTIAQQRFWMHYDELRLCCDADSDKDRMNRVRIAAVKSGLGTTNTKLMLREHPEWKDWTYLEMIDSQVDVQLSPDPEQSKPNTVAPLPPNMDLGTAQAAWQFILDDLKQRVSRHNFETWIKPLRAFGISDRQLWVRVPAIEFHHVPAKFGSHMQAAIELQDLDAVKFVTSDGQIVGN